MKRWLEHALMISPAVLAVLTFGVLIYSTHVSDARRERVQNFNNAVLDAHAAISAAQRVREQRKGDYTDLSDPSFRPMTFGLDDIVPFSGPGYPDVGSFKKFGMHASHVPSDVCMPYVLAASAAFDDVYVGGTGALDRGRSVFYQGSFLDYTQLDAACNASAFVDIDLITH